MRLENGFGSVTKLSGNRRKPYIAKITVGYVMDKNTGKKKQVFDIIGYAATKKEGNKILLDYHRKGKFDYNMTFSNVYEQFLNYKLPDVSKSMEANIRAAYDACSNLYEMIFGNIEIEDLQAVIDQSDKNYPTLRKIKLLLTQMYDYVILIGYMKINIAKGVNIRKFENKNPNSNKRDKINEKDVSKIWQYSESKYYQMILFLIYTGVRVSEMLDLKKEDINLKEKYFDVVNSKTECGIRRVPVCNKIFEFVENWYYSYPDSEYLFNSESGQHFLYRNYYDSYFTPLMENCNMKYTPHFCRHTFISMMALAGVNSTIIKKIVGHINVMSLTERVYTHLEVEEMLEAVNKL